MGMMYCKIKSKTGGRKDKIKKAKSFETNPYKKYDSLNEIEFNSNYKLDPEEIFFISNIKDEVKNKEIIEIKEEDGTSYKEIESEGWSSLHLLLYIEDGIYYFQSVSGKKYLTTEKKLRFLNGSPVLNEEPQGVIIKDIADAVYNSEEDKLYFRNFTKANQIFKGIEAFYREATDGEINTFLSHDIVSKCDDFDIALITPFKRKKIASVMENLDNTPNEILISYGKNYCPQLFEGEKIKVNNIQTLDSLINVAGEFFYTGEMSGNKKLSNSSIEIKS